MRFMEIKKSARSVFGKMHENSKLINKCSLAKNGFGE